MRTMNKIVALALVLAMAFSMMASAASFKDQATINADLMDEINLLVALGVYSENGTGAGYFEPNGTITRSQAAKIIYVLKNKGVDNGATSWTGLNIFSDVEVGSWYEGYVNYCASTGILAGTGDGKYNPNGTLTGVELAKMLLVVIGYKADVEGYTGNNWDANILADAEAAGILVDYELPVRGIITREWSAMMIVNAINATKVKYEDGELVEMYNSNNEAVTYAKQDLGLNSVTGQLVATPNIALDKPANNTNGKNENSKIKVWDADNDTYAATATAFKFDANPELLGQKVTIQFKGESLAKATKIYGMTAHEDVTVVDTTINALGYSAISGDKVNANITVGDYTTEIVAVGEDAETINVYVDYVLVNENAAWGSVSGNATTENSIFDGAAAGSRDFRNIKLIDNNDDGAWDIAMIEDAVYGIVTKHKADKTTINIDVYNNGVKSAITISDDEDYEDINFIDTVEEDDVVKVTYDYSTGSEIMNVELAESMTTVVSSTGSSYIYLADGTTLRTAAGSVAINSSVSASEDEIVLYTDGKYVIYSSEVDTDGDNQTNIALVIKAKAIEDSWGDTTNTVDILKNDGTRATLTYVSDSNLPTDTGVMKFTDVTSEIESGEFMVEYTMKSGKVYFTNILDELNEDADVKTAANKLTIDISEEEVTDGTTTWLMDEDTYFFVIADDDGDYEYAVVKASELQGDITSSKAISVNDKTVVVEADGLPYIKYAVLGVKDTLPTAESTGTTIAIAASYESKVVNSDDTYYTLNVTNLDGTTTTLKSDNSFKTLVDDEIFAYRWVSYTLDSDGFVDEFDCSTSIFSNNDLTRDTLTAFTSSRVALKYAGVKYLADDVEIYFVDSYEKATGYAYNKVIADETELVVADETVDDVIVEGGVFYTLNTDGEIDTIICEVDGEYIWNNSEVNKIN